MQIGREDKASGDTLNWNALGRTQSHSPRRLPAHSLRVFLQLRAGGRSCWDRGSRRDALALSLPTRSLPRGRPLPPRHPPALPFVLLLFPRHFSPSILTARSDTFICSFSFGDPRSLWPALLLLPAPLRPRSLQKREAGPHPLLQATGGFACTKQSPHTACPALSPTGS